MGGFRSSINGDNGGLTTGIAVQYPASGSSPFLTMVRLYGGEWVIQLHVLALNGPVHNGAENTVGYVSPIQAVVGAFFEVVSLSTFRPRLAEKPLFPSITTRK
jgi:hypothetical protein